MMSPIILLWYITRYYKSCIQLTTMPVVGFILELDLVRFRSQLTYFVLKLVKKLY